MVQSILGKPAFQSGDMCGQYQIVALLAHGGLGEVYRAIQPTVSRHVAIKSLKYHLASRKDLKARMEIEGQAMGRISHPNVVTVFDVGITDAGIIWIAMELLEGQTLRELLLGRGKLPVDEAVAVTVAIADGLEAAHKASIIHRDIKPENIFVTHHNAMKLLDLGTAKLKDFSGPSCTVKGRILGTPAYMAPEQLLGGELDRTSDIYSLGIVLYEMLAGHPFFYRVGAEDYAELARCHINEQPRPLYQVAPHVPTDVSRVIDRALKKSAWERYSSMADFANELRIAAGILTPVVRLSSYPAPVRQAYGVADGERGPHGTLRWAANEQVGVPEQADDETIPDQPICPPIVPLGALLVPTPETRMPIIRAQPALRMPVSVPPAPGSTGGEDSASISSDTSKDEDGRNRVIMMTAGLILGLVTAVLLVLFWPTLIAPVDSPASAGLRPPDPIRVEASTSPTGSLQSVQHEAIGVTAKAAVSTQPRAVSSSRSSQGLRSTSRSEPRSRSHRDKETSRTLPEIPSSRPLTTASPTRQREKAPMGEPIF